MRFLTFLLTLPVLAAFGWAGWWYVGAEAQERALAAWFEDRREAGWQAEHGPIEVEGFPTDFERRVEDLVLTDPAQGWSLRAPWLASASATFRLNRFTVTAPPTFSFAVPGETVAVALGPNAFELGVAPMPSMPVRDASLALSDLALAAPDWRAGAARIEARIAEKPPAAAPENSYDLTLEAQDLRLPETLVAELDPTGKLSPEFERLILDAHATLDHTLDRDFVEAGELSARTIVIRKAAFEWGEMALAARGRLEADSDGFAEGKLNVSLTNWKQMIRLAEDAGTIGREIASGIEAALELASLFSSRDGALEVGLKFRDGRIYIGPVAVGEAPRIGYPPRERVEG